MFNIVKLDRRIRAYLPVCIPGIAFLVFMFGKRNWTGPVFFIGSVAGGVLENFGIYVREFQIIMGLVRKHGIGLLFFCVVLCYLPMCYIVLGNYRWTSPFLC